MEKKELKTDYLFGSYEELEAADRNLVDASLKATTHSYSPYSHFQVGAAVLLADGTIVQGANQENAAYPSGLCAERTAVFSAQAQYPEQAVKALALVGCNEQGVTAIPAWPCGACRQVILEVEERYHQPIRILVASSKGVYIFHSIKDLLPFCFVDGNMK
ncbi:MAG: cytidine deaminase [Prevotella sp.]|nr:cytidine deaminase [Prevotella sp.]